MNLLHQSPSASSPIRERKRNRYNRLELLQLRSAKSTIRFCKRGDKLKNHDYNSSGNPSETESFLEGYAYDDLSQEAHKAEFKADFYPYDRTRFPLGGKPYEASVNESSNAGGYEYDYFWNTSAAMGATPEDQSHHVGIESFGSSRFSTKYYDEETGFYYYGYRYYDPQTGRWPSRDPISEKGGINLYGFVGNDGVNHWDILGKEAAAAGAPVGAGVGATVTSLNPYVRLVMVTTAAACEARNLRIAIDDYRDTKRRLREAEEQLKKVQEDLARTRARILDEAWPLDRGAEEWGRRNGEDPTSARRRAHRIKGEDNCSGATDDYKVDVDTGNVLDPEGEPVGNLND